MSILLPSNPIALNDSNNNNILSVYDSGVVINDDNISGTNIKLITDNNIGLYISDTQRIGININEAPEKRLVINDEIGECIRLIYNKKEENTIENMGNYSDINITQNGSLDIKLDNDQYFNIINNNNTPNLKLNNQIVYSTANQLNYNNINQIGYAEPSKALILDTNSNLAGINKLELNELQLNSSLLLTMESFNYSIDVTNQTGRLIKLQRHDSSSTLQILESGILSICNNNNIIEFLGNENTESIFPVHLTTEGNTNNTGIGIKFNTYNNNNIKKNISSIETVITNNQNNNEDSIIKFNNMNSGVLENTVTIRNDGTIACTGLVELSDSRTKQILNDSKIHDSLEKICKIDIYDYIYLKDNKKIIHKGLMAQELKEIIPSAVIIDNTPCHDIPDLHTISNKEIIGYLIDSIKALTLEINIIKNN